MKIIVVVLQYNHSEETLKCLESLSLVREEFFSVVVVDNASEQKHQLAAQYYCQSNSNWCYFLPLSENRGYGAGNNAGIRYALSRGGEAVLILNNDTRVPSDGISYLKRFLENEVSVGIVCPVIQENNVNYYGGTIKWLQPELKHSTAPLETDFLPDNLYAPGMALLIRSNVFKKAGFFDEKFFLYFEDVEFCQRARKAGYKIGIATYSIIFHIRGASTSILGSPLLLRYHYRNALLLNKLCGPWWARLLLYPWTLGLILRQAVKSMYFPAKRNTSRAISAGVFDFYRKRWGIITNL